MVSKGKWIITIQASLLPDSQIIGSDTLIPLVIIRNDGDMRYFQDTGF
jgi:hypothetical protein